MYESKTLVKHKSCECRCELMEENAIQEKNWSDDKCQYECKKPLKHRAYKCTCECGKGCDICEYLNTAFSWKDLLMI